MSNEPIENGNQEFQGRDLEAAKKLIEAVRKQFELENQQLEEYRKEVFDAKDFKVSKFAFYDGPNYYLPCKAMVFNVFIAPVGDTVGFFRDEISKEIPLMAESKAEYVIDLYAETLLQITKMEIDLYINRFRIGADGDDYVVAMEYLDKDNAEECAYLVSDWFYAISHNKLFNFRKEWEKLQDTFNKSLFGGPTIYSLVEAGLKRNIPVFYLFEENQFQWGYGKKQLRGRSTTFHNDGIKDTEFTQFKDMCGDFLEMCGFPTPKGFNTFTVEDAIAAAEKIGYPCVIKPVNGHKGQGVTTGVMNEAEARVAFQNILTIGEIHEVPFQGALVQTQIYGTDHRLLAVNGKFAAALQRVPAFVEGNGENNIKDLIATENEKIIRLDNARSPLCKINIDDDLLNYLALQHKSLNDIPAAGESFTLRRVANISAGGVSYNVTDKIHPDNIRLVEDIASYLTIRNLGVDVLAADISKSWRDGDFGIIEINAGPGVFMHLAPAYGGSIDVPEKIIMSHFGKPENARVPIIATNGLSASLVQRINNAIHEIDNNAFFGYLLIDGVYFNGELFYNNPDHIQNEKMILRKPQVTVALFTETKDSIFDYGMLFEGADMVILDEADPVEVDTISEQLLPSGQLIVVAENNIQLIINDEVVDNAAFETPEQKDDILFGFIERHLKDLVCKYNDIEKLHG